MEEVIKFWEKSKADFMKGLRLSPVSGEATSSNLSLLDQSQLRPSLSNNQWLLTTVVFCVMPPFCSKNLLLVTYLFLA